MRAGGFGITFFASVIKSANDQSWVTPVSRARAAPRQSLGVRHEIRYGPKKASLIDRYAGDSCHQGAKPPALQSVREEFATMISSSTCRCTVWFSIGYERPRPGPVENSAAIQSAELIEKPWREFRGEPCGPFGENRRCAHAAKKADR